MPLDETGSATTLATPGVVHEPAVAARLAWRARITRPQWSWRVDELPTDLAEDTLPAAQLEAP